MTNLGNIIKSLRLQKNWSQDDLAKRIGVKKSSVSAYENDLRLPSYETLIEIARVFDVSTDYLLEIENNRTIDISGLSESEIAAVRHLINVMKYKYRF